MFHKVLSAAILSACALSSRGLAEDAKLPRYDFTIGRQLTYVVTDRFAYQNGSMEDLSSVRITVAGRNSDGSFQIVIRTAERSVQNSKGNPPASVEAAKEEVDYSHLDMRPDGRMVQGSADTGNLPHESAVELPPLPTNAAQSTGTWTRESVLPGETEVFTSTVAPSGDAWTFHSTTRGLFRDVYGMVQDRTYRFDRTKGVILSVEDHYRQDYGFHGSGTGHFQLESDRILTPDQTRSLASDCQALFDVQSTVYRKVLAVDASANVAGLKGELARLITRAMNRVSLPEIKSALEETRKSLGRRINSSVEDARRIASFVNRPVPDIIACDMDGHPHKLGDYRGKVVVLDFWYRGCGWCIRSMPQLKRVAGDLKNQPFALLGMNTDRDPANARFIMDAMKLNYTTLRVSPSEAARLKVQAFPSLLIIDREGILREFDEGYSPHLRDDLETKVRTLLKSPSVASTQPANQRG